MCVIPVYLDHQNFATPRDQAQQDVCHFDISVPSELSYYHRPGIPRCVSFWYICTIRTLLHPLTRHTKMCAIFEYLDHQNLATPTDQAHQDMCHFFLLGLLELCYSLRPGTAECVSFRCICIFRTLLHPETRHTKIDQSYNLLYYYRTVSGTVIRRLIM